MKIKQLQLEEFGPYRNWSFTAGQKGVQLIYGANESGKTSLLEGMRTILFGGKAKGYATCIGSMIVEHEGHDYYIGRHQKRLDFYPLGESPITQEPAAYWWHGLSKKTYNRIFALTLADLQGVQIVQEVDVRTRFFGAEGGESLSAVVQNIEKASQELLVTSVNGKRKINRLVEALQQNQSRIAELSAHEVTYRQLQQQLDNTILTERELLDQLQERQAYIHSVDLVLQAWETYGRAEEAKKQISMLASVKQLERDRFLALDRELNQCREHMQIWRDKEAGLMPDHFSPQSPLGVYAQDIEELYQEVSKWDQLRKECKQGEAYLEKVQEQLALSRTLHSAWRSDVPMDTDINWYEGERLSNQLRIATANYEQWQAREPVLPKELEGHEAVVNGSPRPTVSPEAVQDIRRAYAALQDVRADQKEWMSKRKWWLKVTTVAWVMAAIGIFMVLLGVALAMMPLWIGIALLVIGISGGTYSYWQGHRASTNQQEMAVSVAHKETALRQLVHQYEVPMPTSEADLQEIERTRAVTASMTQDVTLMKAHAYQELCAHWREEGKTLEGAKAEALLAWQQWLPAAARRTLVDIDFFAMKQEYDHYLEQLHLFKGYERRMEEHRAALNAIEERAHTLWDNVGMKTAVTPSEMRRLYRLLKEFRQKKIRWEQKESQRKNFREEFDQWNRKEKDVLLAQDELIQRSGLQSAAEYRQQLLRYDQLKQWETIYHQSRIQLDLIAKQDDNPDILYRRLREGNYDKWVSESKHNADEVAIVEQKLADLYEKRGTITEAMRTLADDVVLANTLQEREALESELSEALEEWATQVFMHHAMDLAQREYEVHSRPHMLSLASDYVSSLTNGQYTLEQDRIEETVYVKDCHGQRKDSRYWSSGLGDQVYLALRLALATSFSERVEPLPLVLDDILVRFDQDRQEQALSLLRRIGATQQVWIFTCQRELLAMARKQDGIDTYVLEDQNVVALS